MLGRIGRIGRIAGRGSVIALALAGAVALAPRPGVALAAPAMPAAACAVVTPTADVTPPNDFTTVANIVANFNYARQQEGCATPLTLDATAFQNASPQQQMLILLNAERGDRGLPALQLDTTLLSRIASNHSQEMVDYKYFDHPSPLHNSLFDKQAVDPLLANMTLGENISYGATTGSISAAYPPAEMVYGYMYQDSSSSWGHRQNILTASFTWAGIGFATGQTTGPDGTTFNTAYNTIDFLGDSAANPYTPPATADTTPPGLDAPTITANPPGGPLTVQVTNVGDGDAPPGVGDVVGVVFYLGAAVAADGSTYQTVAATQSQSDPGTWTATLPAPAGGTVGTLHAVAVDGSGNYLDCAAGAGICRATSGGIEPPPMGGAATPELGSGELLATALLPLGIALLARLRRARRAARM